MKETFESYLQSLSNGAELKQLLEGCSRLERYIDGKLIDLANTEKAIQDLRKSIYMDAGLSPLDKRIFPELLKRYYTYITQEELSTPSRLTKGQSSNRQ